MGKIKSKFRVKGVKKSDSLSDASKVLLSEKLKEVFISVDHFFEDDSVKNLHQLRISLRRFRYLLETLSICVDEKLFNYAHKRCKTTLDALGSGRDLDVMTDKLKDVLSSNKIPNSAKILSFLRTDSEETREKIKMELIKFICDKNINKFFKKKKNR